MVIGWLIINSVGEAGRYLTFLLCISTKCTSTSLISSLSYLGLQVQLPQLTHLVPIFPCRHSNLVSWNIWMKPEKGASYVLTVSTPNSLCLKINIQHFPALIYLYPLSSGSCFWLPLCCSFAQSLLGSQGLNLSYSQYSLFQFQNCSNTSLPLVNLQPSKKELFGL